MNKKWIVTSFNHDISWINDYTQNYLIFDKSCSLQETDKIKHQKNVGYNIYDTFYFIVNNYNNLPDVCVFIKGNVLNRAEPHCTKEKFDRIINNNILTPIESYEHIVQSQAQILDENGGYMEINNSWYINAVGVKKFFNSFDQFLNTVFEDAVHRHWNRFAPGANYIVPKDNILFYSKDFYKRLMGYVDYHQTPSEAHVLERAMFTIWKNEFKEKS